MSLIVVIHNDGTGTEEIANYDYEVRVNDEVIERGVVKNHNRKSGWQVLLSHLAKESLKNA